MPLQPGTRFGPYEILSVLGAGGMGEVYRARDTRLDRTVALKVLTGALAADAESRRRFEVEARSIAALNDPHICTLHDIGLDGELDYLVFEYLEGETLADRLRRSGALPLDEALAMAIQIGDALDRAHSAGIAHHDLKPGNVMLVRRAGGSNAADVKLLDFGLAARTSVARPRALDATMAATMAPVTEATRPATSSSGFVGTVQYTAPERLDGDTGDHRADIFAFGCVLYEMLAGRKAFEGGSVLTAMAAIKASEPPPIPGLQSSALDHVLRRCLEKDRDRRWQSIRDVTGELRWLASRPDPPAAARAKSSRAVPVALALALVAAAAVAFGVWAMRGRGAAAAGPAFRFEIATAPTDDSAIALSPDGTALAFIANKDRVPMLWVRTLDAIDSRLLPGTDGASFPFWAPDGKSLGFFAADKLKRVDVAGGAPFVIADAPNARGGAWGADGVVLFSPGVSAPIKRVAASGGAVETVTQISITGGSGSAHRLPQFLPGGKRFLFSSTLGGPDTNGVYLGSLDKTPPVRVIADGTGGRFVAPDRLLAIRRGALEAYSFDLATGAVQGEPTIIAQGFANGSSTASFASADSGVIAYRAGAAQRRQLVWVNRKGDVVRVIGEPESDYIASPELSADEQSVVVFTQRSGGNDVWVIELARNLARRITDGPMASAHPIWDPDGDHVVFNSSRFPGGTTRQALNGGQPEPLFPKVIGGMALSWTRDRQYVLLRRNTGKSMDLVAVTTKGEPREIPVTQSPYDETEGQFSPDGRWVAFVSNESGRNEVFVQSFPDGRARTQVSTAGGAQVRWSADGKEIFYVAPDGRMMAALLTSGGAAPQVALPAALFQTHLATGTNVIGNKPQYAVSRDGRFLLDTAVESSSAPIVVMVNWTKALAK